MIEATRVADYNLDNSQIGSNCDFENQYSVCWKAFEYRMKNRLCSVKEKKLCAADMENKSKSALAKKII